MSFSAGDILIKLDLKFTADTINTRHHVMLVLGETQEGAPIIAHMSMSGCKLIKEELTRGKDLIHLCYPWAEETRRAFVQAAEESLSSGKFVINREIIQKQLNEVSPFRPQSSLDSSNKLLELRKAYEGSPINFAPNPDQKTIVSCHEWVISLIHYVCNRDKICVPVALQIPPRLAWADRLWYSAKNDEMVTLVTTEQSKKANVTPPPVLIKQPEASRITNSLFSFFYQCPETARSGIAILADTFAFSHKH